MINEWSFRFWIVAVISFCAYCVGVIAHAETDASDDAAGFAGGEVHSQVHASSGGSKIEPTSEFSADGELGSSPFSMTYFGIFYGPSVGSPSSFQATPDGTRDLNKPLLLKNFVSLNYQLSEKVGIGVTGNWHFVPVGKHENIMQDPYAMISHNSIFAGAGFNLYGDFRVYAPVTKESRAADMLASAKIFEMLTYEPPSSRMTLALNGWVRGSYFGKFGTGYDLETYLAPNVSYQITESLSGVLAYEMGASHIFGKKAFVFENDGADLQPSLSWDVTRNLNLNPFLNIYTGGKVSLNTTMMGMMVYWKML